MTPTPSGLPSGLPYGFPMSLLSNSAYGGHPLLNPPPTESIIHTHSDKKKQKSATPPPAPALAPAPAPAAPVTTAPQRSNTPFKCGICDYATTHKDHFLQHQMAHAAADNRDLIGLFGVSTEQLHLPQQQPRISSPASHQGQVKDYINRMLSNPLLLASGLAKGMNTAPLANKDLPVDLPLRKVISTPLDLSRDKDDAAVPHKHRRKGQAFKLERVVIQSPVIPSPVSQSVGSQSSGDDEEQQPAARKEPAARSASGDGAWGGAYQCAYCDIAFKDVVMYTMHMGYHGYQDPFTCNMCGHQTHDKLAFFLHIARSSHS